MAARSFRPGDSNDLNKGTQRGWEMAEAEETRVLKQLKVAGLGSDKVSCLIELIISKKRRLISG
jgi:hypothetical protein